MTITMDLINEILHWVCLYVLVWYGYILIVNKGVPNIKTAPAVRKKMVELFQRDMNERGIKPYKIVDLGSGNGDLTRHLARNLPDAHVIGVEISPIAYYRSVLIQKLFGIKNLEYQKMSFYDFDLSTIDAIVVFQLGSELYHLSKKFKEELRPGSFILANRFELPAEEWTAFESVDTDTMAFNQKTLHLYRA